ncbi:MAG: tRNA dihydrouridine(20/20a) synthase DusA [bacterium]
MSHPAPVAQAEHVSSAPQRLLSVAPMMDWTDRHYRYFARRLTKHALLYTEMITTGAIIHGDRDRLLSFHPEERPLSLQIGGDDPAACAESVRIAADYGYDEFDLNVGCPSDRVQNGSFGACLMAAPDRVARIVEAMKAATGRPVTVKHRVGIDGRESYEEMADFVERVARSGADRFIVHARIAVLSGLNPKENRSIPPLRYNDVYRLKEQFPELTIEINGHIGGVEAVKDHLERVDGVMVGRSAYERPFWLREVDRVFFGATAGSPTRRQVIDGMIPYIESVQARGRHPRAVFRHMLGLFADRPGAKAWKRALSGKLDPHMDVSRFLRDLTARLPREVLDE